MSVTLSYKAEVTVVETLTTNVPAAGSPQITHSGFNSTHALNAASTPPVTIVANFNKALSGGAGTIDLTALPGTNGAVQDGTGLKVQSFFVKAPLTNANPITLKFGASNPYNLCGASWQVILSPGQEFLWYGNDATPDVASGAKNIDMSGTGTQSADVSIVLG